MKAIERSGSLHGKPVLIVENNAMIGMALSTQFTIFGFECDTVFNKIDMLSLIDHKLSSIEAEFYQVILIDQKSVQFEGIELARLIREKL